MLDQKGQNSKVALNNKHLNSKGVDHAGLKEIRGLLEHQYNMAESQLGKGQSNTVSVSRAHNSLIKNKDT